MLHHVAWLKLTDISEAVNTSETSVSFYQTTRRNIPEDSDLHTGRREDLRSHLKYYK
jgi:hypothetical protein